MASSSALWMAVASSAARARSDASSASLVATGSARTPLSRGQVPATACPSWSTEPRMEPASANAFDSRSSAARAVARAWAAARSAAAAATSTSFCARAIRACCSCAAASARSVLCSRCRTAASALRAWHSSALDSRSSSSALLAAELKLTAASRASAMLSPAVRCWASAVCRASARRCVRSSASANLSLATAISACSASGWSSAAALCPLPCVRPKLLIPTAIHSPSQLSEVAPSSLAVAQASASRSSPSCSRRRCRVSPSAGSVHSKSARISRAVKRLACWLASSAVCVRIILNSWSRSILSSMRPLMTSRYTRTSRSWPMRYARSTAWASVAGFHAGSTSTTRSAPVRFSPTPPTPVVSNMHWKRSRCSWNFRTFSARSLGSVWPSIRRQRSPWGRSTQICTRSSILRLWEKTRVRCPFAASAGSSRAMHLSLPLCASSSSVLLPSLRSIASAERPARASSAMAAPAASGSFATSSPASTPSSPGLFDHEALVASDISSFQAPGFDNGSARSGWLQSLFKRPMARKTSRLSLVLLAASRITSLASSTFL
mmetsp:Transcript_111507/g.302689  ORF Transcript_111507/g.302689 Transcript_111507/m.302689 type:complete len:551 (+) Transcript_111507:905-2557(+)